MPQNAKLRTESEARMSMKLLLVGGTPYIVCGREAKYPKEACVLADRLLKFFCRETPNDYARKGELWGEGQLYVEGRDGITYRTQIDLSGEVPVERQRELADFYFNRQRRKKRGPPIPPWLLALLPLKYPLLLNENPHPGADGLSIQVRCVWIAKRHPGVQLDQWGIQTPSWEWTLVPSSSFMNLTVEKFHQNKSYSKGGVLHPKRLFFETAVGEPGHFAQRNDPENIRLEKGVFTDPLHPLS